MRVGLSSVSGSFRTESPESRRDQESELVQAQQAEGTALLHDSCDLGGIAVDNIYGIGIAIAGSRPTTPTFHNLLPLYNISPAPPWCRTWIKPATENQLRS